MNRLHTVLASTAGVAALAAFTAAEPAAAPANPDFMLKFTLPNIDGEQSFDVSTIPADIRLDFLKGAVRSYVANRVNSAYQRHQKDDAVIAWFAYEEATAADPLQSAVAKPTVEKPAEPDLAATLAKAYEDLTNGNVRKVGAEPKARVRKDPLISLITSAVVKDVFDGRKAVDPKYSFLSAKAEVGADGLAYLNKLIEEKVALGADRAGLEKMREQKYVGPAKVMLGITVNKALDALPSIL